MDTEGELAMEELLASVAEAASQAKFARRQCRFIAEQCSTLVDVALIAAQGKASRSKVSSLLQQTLELLNRCSDPRRWLWEAFVRLENATVFGLLSYQLHKCALHMLSEAVDREVLTYDQVGLLLQPGNSGMDDIRAAIATCACKDREELMSIAANEQQHNPEMCKFWIRRLASGNKILQIYSSESLELNDKGGPGFLGYRATLWGCPVVVNKLRSWQEDQEGALGVIGVIEQGGKMLLVSEYDRTREVQELASYRMWEIFNSMLDPRLTDEVLACGYCEVLSQACFDLNASIQEMLFPHKVYMEEVLSFLTKSLLIVENCSHVAPSNADIRAHIDRTLLEMITLVDSYKADHLRGKLVELIERFRSMVNTGQSRHRHLQGVQEL